MQLALVTFFILVLCALAFTLVIVFILVLCALAFTPEIMAIKMLQEWRNDRRE